LVSTSAPSKRAVAGAVVLALCTAQGCKPRLGSRVRFLFDEDFNGHIVQGFRRRQPAVNNRSA
jgi:hypothetical protein